MKQNFVVAAETRADQGKGASRRLRREGKIPAIVYGGTEPAVALTLSANEIGKQLKVAGTVGIPLALVLCAFAGTIQHQDER